MKCQLNTCNNEGEYWYIELNHPNTRRLSGSLCIEHYNNFLDFLKAMLIGWAVFIPERKIENES